MKRKYPFTSILGWSVSRYDKFMACKRQYWYDYYAKNHDNEISPQKLAQLKSLTSVPLEIGNLVHDAIATQLHRIRKNTLAQSTSEITGYSSYLVDRAILGKTFLEVYSGRQDRIDADELKGRVGICLETFFGSPRYRWLLETATDRRNEWIIEPNDFGEIRINGLKAYCKVDFLFPTAQNDFYILDWKTGKADDQKHGRQMMGYVLYARDILKAQPEKVTPMIVYLGETYREMTHNFTSAELDAFAGQIQDETNQMYDLCRDISQNIPKPKDCFPQNVTRLCSYCSYQEFCSL